MPYIETKLSIKLDETQKNDLQIKLTNAVESALSKPKAYIMASIEDNKSLYMAGEQIEKGAYIAIRMLGNTTKPACRILTNDICEILNKDYNIDSSKVYISYHPVELWGWNNMMF